MHKAVKARAPAVRVVTVVMMAGLLSGCSLGYYGQAALGQLRLSTGSEPVAALLEDPELDPALRARLELSQAALQFAHDDLSLPDNGSYRAYTDTGRPAVVWNVYAAPELSIEPRTWCFPIAGCVAYRGYFSEVAARKFAARRQAAGDDVFVGEVAAYSTLGRLKDPLLNTMLPMSDSAFVGLLFHELAHQRLYVADDTAFNEAYASALEKIGLRRWRAARGEPPPRAASVRYVTEMRQLLLAYREQLAAAYSSQREPAAVRETKARLLADLTRDYDRRTEGLSNPPYQWLFDGGINNASLAAVATYANYVPAFMALYDDCAGELACWYAAADELAALDAEGRQSALRRWLAEADVVPPPVEHGGTTSTEH